MKGFWLTVLEFVLLSCVFYCYGFIDSDEGNPPGIRGSRIKPRDLLNGLHVRFPLYQLYPYLQRVQQQQTNGTFAAEGFFAEFIEEMVKRYNMTYKYVLVDHASWLIDGNLKSLMNQLLNNETDIAPFTFPRSLEYYEKTYLGVSIAIAPYIFLQRFPLEESRLSAPIRPFTSEVWGLFLCSTFTFIISMTLVMMYNWEETSREPSFSQIAYQNWAYVITILLGQGNSSPSKKFSLRIMLGLWLLMMVVVINAYTGTLTSFLTVPKLEPTIDTFEQLVARKKTMITEKGAFIDEFMLNATSGVYKTIGDKFRRNPDLIMTNYAKIINYVVEHDGVYCGADIIARRLVWAIQNNYNSTGRCISTLAKKTLPYSADSAITMRKEWPYNKIIDQNFVQRYFKESGLMVYIYKKYFPVVEKCNVDGQYGTQDSFDLKSFSSVFMLLVAGLCLSMVAFLVELIIHYVSKKVGANSRKNQIK